MNILTVRTGAIGDTLLTFPLLHTLKTHGAHITFVSNATVLPLAQKLGVADTVFDFSSVAWSELFAPNGIHSSFMLRLLQDIDHAICWLHDLDACVVHNLHVAGVPSVLVVPGRPPVGQAMHVVTYLTQTLRGMFPTLPTPMIQASPFAAQPTYRENRVAIHPGSGGRTKCWPVERFAAIISALWKRRLPVLLLAGPADTESLALLLGKFTPPPGLLNVVVNAPLVEVAERLQGCAAYLGNDAGITHLAALLGLPTVVLFGASDPTLWRPVGPHVYVMHEASMEGITVEYVLHTLLTTLSAV